VERKVRSRPCTAGAGGTDEISSRNLTVHCDSVSTTANWKRSRFLTRIVESGCVTLHSLVLSIRIMCKDLWKLLHDIYISVLTERTYESIIYKPYLTRREMPRITHHVSDVSVVTCLIRNGQIFTSDL
jgi:hypothetical protein